MSEIQSGLDLNVVKWGAGVSGVLFTICSGLIVYIFRSAVSELTAKINKLEAEMLSKYRCLLKKNRADHDLIKTLQANHHARHPDDL